MSGTEGESGTMIQKKISFELNIRACREPSLPDNTHVIIYWVRGIQLMFHNLIGEKKIDTKIKVI